MSESIMTGDRSTTLWKAINRIKKRRPRRAVRALATRCQELEERLEAAVQRIEQLEGGTPAPGGPAAF